jgi:hypothetical protein
MILLFMSTFKLFGGVTSEEVGPDPPTISITIYIENLAALLFGFGRCNNNKPMEQYGVTIFSTASSFPQS